MGKKQKKLKIKFDQKDRLNFLKNKGSKYTKKERKKYFEKKQMAKKRKEKLEQNKLVYIYNNI